MKNSLFNYRLNFQVGSPQGKVPMERPGYFPCQQSQDNIWQNTHFGCGKVTQTHCLKQMGVSQLIIAINQTIQEIISTHVQCQAGILDFRYSFYRFQAQKQHRGCQAKVIMTLCNYSFIIDLIARQMAQVHINNIQVRNNPARILDAFSFDITFECFSPLPGSFDWKIIYIGSPNNSQFDQVIDQFDMDNLAPGVMQFTVQSACPNFSKMPEEEIMGTTAIIISVSYEKQQFFRCGYYVRNEYDENIQEPPKVLSLPDVHRYILSESPRIFRFEIEWTKREGHAYEDNALLQQNLEIMGGDPFQQSNGAIQELEKVQQFSYGMFQNNGNQVPL